jgi:HEAT repeat protein
MSTTPEISIRQVIDALLDESTTFPPRYLYRFSDLVDDELAQIKSSWPSVPLWRRQALLEDIEELSEDDTLLNFEALATIALQDPDPHVRSLAVQILWEYESPELVNVFLNLMQNDTDVNVRATSASALGRFIYLGEVEDIPEEDLHRIEDALIAVLRGSDDAEVRRHALESLGFSSREEIPALIEDAFRSTDKDWVASALFAMGRSANEEWAPLVLSSLDHTFPVVRTEAVRAAGELEISEAVPQLYDLLDDSNEAVRSAAIWSLSQIGGEGVRETLEQLQEDTEDEEEADFIESALDNLTFTEDFQLFSLFDFSSGEDPKNTAKEEKTFLDQYGEVDEELMDSENFDDEDFDLDIQGIEDADFDEDDDFNSDFDENLDNLDDSRDDDEE